MADGRREFSDEAFIEAVRELEPASTPEVADHVGCTRENARLRLIDLHEQGEIEQKQISRGYVWYL